MGGMLGKVGGLSLRNVKNFYLVRTFSVIL